MSGVDDKDISLRAYFDGCMMSWERRHGMRPETRDEMWDAIIDGMEHVGDERNGN